MKNPSECAHQEFDARVNIQRIVGTLDAMAEITISCRQCGEPFRFRGVPMGLDFARPMCSIDSLELRAPIESARAPYVLPAKRQVQ